MARKTHQTLKAALKLLALEQAKMARDDIHNLEVGKPAKHFLFPYSSEDEAYARYRRIDSGAYDTYTKGER